MYESVKDKCSYITPVPGGVGQMTVAMLAKNILKAYKMQNRNFNDNSNGLDTVFCLENSTRLQNGN